MSRNLKLPLQQDLLAFFTQEAVKALQSDGSVIHAARPQPGRARVLWFLLLLTWAPARVTGCRKAKPFAENSQT